MNENPTEKTEKFESWCLVELMGHQKIVGKCTEAVIAGAPLLRVDVPAYQENQPFTRFYGPGAIYCLNPISEQVALEMLKTCRNEPVSRWDIPKLADKAKSPETEYGYSSEDESGGSE